MYETLLAQLKKLVDAHEDIDSYVEAIQEEIDLNEDEEDEEYIEELKHTNAYLEEAKGHIEEAQWYLRKVLKIKKGE